MLIDVSIIKKMIRITVGADQDHNLSVPSSPVLHI